MNRELPLTTRVHWWTKIGQSQRIIFTVWVIVFELLQFFDTSGWAVPHMHRRSRLE